MPALRLRAQPLRRTLPWIMAVLILATTLIIAVITTSALRISLTQTLDSQLLRAAERSAALAMSPQYNDQNDQTPPGLRALGSRTNAISVDVRGGVTRAGYYDSSSGGQAEFHQLSQDQVDTLMAVPTDGNIYQTTVSGLGVYHVFSGFDGSGGRIITAFSLDEVTSTVTQYTLMEMLVAACAVVLTVVVGSLLIRRTLRPLEVLATTAQAVASAPLERGDVQLSERVPDEYVNDRTEVGRTASSFNRMLSHISQAFEARNRSEKKLRQFVADASHELRTPLASIRGYTQLVLRRRTELPPEATDSLVRVESESERMSGLVEDLLLLARLDNEPVIQTSPIDLRPLLIDAVADAHAAGPNHTWVLDMDAEQAIIVDGDEGRMRQILVNLLANARVHTPPGTSVTLRAGLDSEANQAVIAVEDDGPGIPEQLMSTVFDRFAKGDGSRTPGGGGSTGLGLSIAQALTHAHHGTLSVESEVGKYTRFTLRLPLHPSTLAA